MRFGWDLEKNRHNRAKHRLDFETAVLVFDDPNALTIQHRVVEGEQRWQTIGLVGGIALLLVAHTVEEEHGEEMIRIISSRKATPHERRAYEETN